MFTEAGTDSGRNSHSIIEHGSIFLPSAHECKVAELLPCGTPETYGATPLNHMLAYEQQSKIKAYIQDLVDNDVPEAIPAEIAEFIGTTFAVRFHHRSHANHENYLTALRPKSDFVHDPRMIDMIGRAEMGHASPAELLIVRKCMGIRSIELACVSHPYGKRIDHLSMMRSAVREAVELMGGTYFEHPETRYRVKGSLEIGVPLDRATFDTGFFMTRKRTLGVMNDGTIIRERTSFALRTDTAEAVPPVALEAVRQVGAPESYDDKEWQDAVVRAGKLDIIAATLMEADEFSLAIPISTTIYAYNKETADTIRAIQKKERKKERKKDKREREVSTPVLHKVLQAVKNGSFTEDMLE